MKGTRTAAAALLALALPAFAPAPAPGGPPEAVVEAFPGPIQPDPGTRAAPNRRGKVVAFAASFRENGDRYDPAASPTVFLWDRRPGTLRQVSATGPCDQPAAENGTLYLPIGNATVKTHFSRSIVAFRSTANLAGRNADGSAEIFVWDSQTGAITQITDALAGASSDPALGASFNAEVDANGKYTGKVLVRYRVAFLSTSDLTGDNPGGLAQVFVHDSGLPEVERLAQVSHSTTGAAGPPAIDGRGNRVAFRHEDDLVPGYGLPDIYLWDRRRGVRRVEGDGSAPGDPSEPAFDSTGTCLAWTRDYADDATGSIAGTAIALVNRRSGRGRVLRPTLFTSHRTPSLGKGTRPLVCFSTDPGDGGAAVPERPVELDPRDRVREIGLPAGSYGPPTLLREVPQLFLTSTEDLDGSNASGRNVLWLVRFRP